MTSPFDASHTKTYYFKFKGEEYKKETAQTRIANLINTEWQYSLYWKDENYQWIEQAKNDLQTEISAANKRLMELKEADRLLNLIDKVEVEQS